MKGFSSETNRKIVLTIQYLKKFVWEMVTATIPALLIALVINVQVAKAVEIESGPSMQPNMYQGYRLMIEKVSYRFHLPQRGDIVVVDRPGEEVSLVKRVMGLPGETVEVRDGHVLIDGQKIKEPWIPYYGGPDYGPEKYQKDTYSLWETTAKTHETPEQSVPCQWARLKGECGWYIGRWMKSSLCPEE